MAYFAELDANNIVLRVISVSNQDTSDANGVEKEHIGAAFCERLLGGRWKQTSYNSRIRKNYAGPGFMYREDIDAFIAPQPYASWSLNEETGNWEPPTARPTDGKFYSWDEDTTSWVAVTED